MKTKWMKYKEKGESTPSHWTKSNTVSFCPKCDKTFRTITLADRHLKESDHGTFRKKFYVGQRHRNIYGERNGRAKLTNLERKFLRRLYRDGVSTYVLGLYFNITQQAAHTIAVKRNLKSLLNNLIN